MEVPLLGLLIGFGPDGFAVCAATWKAASSGRKKLEKRIVMYYVLDEVMIAIMDQ